MGRVRRASTVTHHPCAGLGGLRAFGANPPYGAGSAPSGPVLRRPPQAGLDGGGPPGSPDGAQRNPGTVRPRAQLLDLFPAFQTCRRIAFASPAEGLVPGTGTGSRGEVGACDVVPAASRGAVRKVRPHRCATRQVSAIRHCAKRSTPSSSPSSGSAWRADRKVTTSRAGDCGHRPCGPRSRPLLDCRRRIRPRRPP